MKTDKTYKNAQLLCKNFYEFMRGYFFIDKVLYGKRKNRISVTTFPGRRFDD